LTAATTVTIGASKVCHAVSVPTTAWITTARVFADEPGLTGARQLTAVDDVQTVVPQLERPRTVLAVGSTRPKLRPAKVMEPPDSALFVLEKDTTGLSYEKAPSNVPTCAWTVIPTCKARPMPGELVHVTEDTVVQLVVKHCEMAFVAAEAVTADTPKSSPVSVIMAAPECGPLGMITPLTTGASYVKTRVAVPTRPATVVTT
jgi:hypothetical protein